MEALLGISLYSYFCLKLAKPLCLSYVFSSTKLENKRAEQVLPGRGFGGRGELAQTTYTHVSKCKNDRIKARKKIQQQQKWSQFGEMYQQYYKWLFLRTEIKVYKYSVLQYASLYILDFFAMSITYFMLGSNYLMKQV
jgi:hypothetical protein